MSKELIQELNTQVSTWSVMYTKLHNYHWYVKGIIFSLCMQNLKNYTMKQPLIWMKLLNGF